MKLSPMKSFPSVILALGVLAPCDLVQARDLTVLNPGFESPIRLVVGEYGPATDWHEGTYAAANPGVWVLAVGEYAGNWNPDAVDGFTNGDAFAGQHIGWTTSRAGIDGGLAQILADTLQANTEYVLSAQVGNSFYNGSNDSADNRLELLAGGVLLQSVTGTSPGTDAWEPHTLTYTSGPNPAQLGQPLEIRLIAVDYTAPAGDDGYEVEWDEVSLTTTPSYLGLEIELNGPDLVFRWESKPGKLYDILSAPDLTTPPASWTPLVSGLAATPPINTATYPRPADPTHFYAIGERDPPPIFFDDFEGVPGNWTTGSDGAAGTLWELGNPDGLAFSGPLAAYSPDNCFGTNVGGEYQVDANIWLRSPGIDLSDVTSATLIFRQWVDIYEFVPGDLGTLRILDATDLPGTVTELAVLEAEVQGATNSWVEYSAALPPAAMGEIISLEFRLVSDEIADFFAGWYIDDVLLKP